MIGFTEHWNQYLESIPANQQDLYFREEYVRLYETESEKAFCFPERHKHFVVPILAQRIRIQGENVL